MTTIIIIIIILILIITIMSRKKGWMQQYQWVEGVFSKIYELPAALSGPRCDTSDLSSDFDNSGAIHT